jgi:hypothetical protein
MLAAFEIFADGIALFALSMALFHGAFSAPGQPQIFCPNFKQAIDEPKNLW